MISISMSHDSRSSDEKLGLFETDATLGESESTMGSLFEVECSKVISSPSKEYV